MKKEIYAYNKVSPKEILAYRKVSERAMVDLLNIDGDEGATNALCKSFEVTNQLLKSTLLRAKTKNEDRPFQKALEKLIHSQIESLKLNKTLFTD
ncbi:hypothetical protein [Cellulophaga baltica]|uniref:hypothetical protein n=1 Tax=Cellulophaga baltica TaxID=76594 RepID=UPI000424FC58|nr:hypothetical protein [Cellulophaga baltica]